MKYYQGKLFTVEAFLTISWHFQSLLHYVKHPVTRRTGQCVTLYFSLEKEFGNTGSDEEMHGVHE